MLLDDPKNMNTIMYNKNINYYTLINFRGPNMVSKLV